MTINLSSAGTQGDEPDGQAKSRDVTSPDAHLGSSPSRARQHLSAGHGVYASDSELSQLRAAHNAKHHRGADGAVVTTEAGNGNNQYSHDNPTHVQDAYSRFPADSRAHPDGAAVGHLRDVHGHAWSHGLVPTYGVMDHVHKTLHATKHTEAIFDDTIDELIAAVVALDLPDSSPYRAESLTEDHLCWGHDCGSIADHMAAYAGQTYKLSEHLNSAHHEHAGSGGEGKDNNQTALEMAHNELHRVAVGNLASNVKPTGAGDTKSLTLRAHQYGTADHSTVAAHVATLTGDALKEHLRSPFHRDAEPKLLASALMNMNSGETHAWLHGNDDVARAARTRQENAARVRSETPHTHNGRGYASNASDHRHNQFGVANNGSKHMHEDGRGS